MRQNRTNLVLGILLILFGGWLVVSRQVPAVQDWLDNNFTWPMWTIGAGLIIFFMGLLTGAPGMAIPASIVAGIGGILYYQNQTGDFGSWSYMWALIPGFVGVGTILAGLLGDFEFDRPACLPLADRRPVHGIAVRGDIFDLEANDIATAKLAVDGEIEQRQISSSTGDL